MGNLQDFTHALTHWSFGIAILIGLAASEYSGAEIVIAILIAGIVSTLSAICGSTTPPVEELYHRRRFGDFLHFLIIWLDILTNLTAAATCARLASATIDYVGKGHFRVFFLGLEQHSLGEPWPDVLGVTIIAVSTVLFMMGLEKSPAISTILLASILCNFAFFSTIGSFHTVITFSKWCERFKIHSYRKVLTAAGKCSFAFVHNVPITQRNNCLKITTMVFNPLIFYTVTAIIFSMMTRYRELVGRAIPLIQVFESRDVDWARPIIAASTICIVCLVLIEVMPVVYASFVKLASKEWGVFISSIQYQSPISGAPVLAIFAAGSLVSILAFACPLSHLIKLLNTSAILKCVMVSYEMLYSRYRAELNYDCLVYNTNVQYSKISNNASRPSTSGLQSHMSIKERMKYFFGKKPQYLHRLTSPSTSNVTRKLISSSSGQKQEENECLLLDDYSNKSLNIDVEDDSFSETGDNELVTCSDNGDSDGSTTDIDLVVEEYREGLKVATLGKFTQRKPATKLTSIITMCFLSIAILSSIVLSLYVTKIIDLYWPSLLGISISTIIISTMPQNLSEKSKGIILPSILMPFFNITSITLNIILFATIVSDIWQALVFWILAGLILFWRCDCCSYEKLVGVPRLKTKVNPILNSSNEYKENITEVICVSR